MKGILLKTIITCVFIGLVVFTPSKVKAVLCDVWDGGDFVDMNYVVTNSTVTKEGNIKINGTFDNGLCYQNCSLSGEPVSKRAVADPIGQLRWYVDGVQQSPNIARTAKGASGGWYLNIPSSPTSCIPYPSSLFGKYEYKIRDAIVDISFLPTGTYTLKLQAYAEPGRYFETSYDFTIDETPPTCSIHYQCNSGYSSCTDATTWTNSSTGYIKLDESDVGSGIKSGNVDKNSAPQGGSWSGWSDLPNTINNFSTALSSDCTYYRFRYQVTDNANNVSAWSDPGWQLRVDKTDPVADISYPCNSSFTGCINSTTWQNSNSIYINLNESDSCSGIQSGNLDVRSMPQGGSWSSWGDYSTTTSNTVYPGGHCISYMFRYQVTDNANNVSTWDDPGWAVRIDTVNPNAAISWSPLAPDANPTTDNTIDISLSEDDECSGIDSGLVQVRTKVINAPDSTWTSWADLNHTITNFTFTGSNNICYTFRYRTTDNATNVSAWSEPGTRTCIVAPNSAPTATLIAPSHDEWINYNPTFTAR